MNCDLANISKCFYINLDRRTDRRDYMEKTLPFHAQRFSAFDGQSMKITQEIKELHKLKMPRNSETFESWAVKLTESSMACNMSHYTLWKQLTKDRFATNYLILEDDVAFKGDFPKEWNTKYAPHMPDDYLVIYPGGLLKRNERGYKDITESYNKYYRIVKENIAFARGINPRRYHHMNTQSYILSKVGAEILCCAVENYGFHRIEDVYILAVFAGAVDPDLSKFFNTPTRVYHTDPQMTLQVAETEGNLYLAEDSDIREKFIPS